MVGLFYCPQHNPEVHMQKKSHAVSKTRLLSTQEASEMFNLAPSAIFPPVN